jgi:hypothetical protein
MIFLGKIPVFIGFVHEHAVGQREIKKGIDGVGNAS